MIHDLIAVYQFFAAIFVTLCFDVVFKNFAWDENMTKKILQGFESSGKLNSQEEEKKKVRDLLDKKYADFFSHSRILACIYLLYSIVLLFVSSCSYWFVNNTYRLFLVNNLTEWMIIYVICVLILFVFFRRMLFACKEVVFIIIAFGLLLPCEHYYFLLSTANQDVISNVSPNELEEIILGLCSVVVLLLPLVYYFVHGRIYVWLYRKYINCRVDNYNVKTNFDNELADILLDTSEDYVSKLFDKISDYEENAFERICTDLDNMDLWGTLRQTLKLQYSTMLTSFSKKHIVKLNRSINRLSTKIKKTPTNQEND